MNRTLMSLGICLCGLICYAQPGKQDNIRFSFTALREKNSIIVNASLHNTGADTVYFLSTSCDGLPYSLQFDTTKFTVYPRILCNASWPIMLNIPPGGSLDFVAHFQSRKKEDEMKLGFDLYEVDKSFDLNQRELNIHFRNAAVRNTIWADVHRFD